MKMYIDGEHVNKIAEQCGCSVKAVYKMTAKHGIHRRKRIRNHKPVPEPKPKPKPVEEPMYREIPSHMSINAAINDRQKALQDELKKYRQEHEKPWYLK